MLALSLRIFFTYLHDAKEWDFIENDNGFTAVIGLLNGKGFAAPHTMRMHLSEARNSLNNYKNNLLAKNGKRHILALPLTEYWKYFKYKNRLIADVYHRGGDVWIFPLFFYSYRDIGSFYIPSLFYVLTGKYLYTYFLVLLSVFDTICVLLLYLLVRNITNRWDIATVSALLYAVSPIIFTAWGEPEYPIFIYDSLIVCVFVYSLVESQEKITWQGICLVIFFAAFVAIASIFRMTVAPISIVFIALIFFKAIFSRENLYLKYGFLYFVMIICFNNLIYYHIEKLPGEKRNLVSFACQKPSHSIGPMFFKNNSSIGNNNGILVISDAQYYTAIKYKFPLLYPYTRVWDYMTSYSETLLTRVALNRTKGKLIEEFPKLIRKGVQAIYSQLFFDVHSYGERGEAEYKNYLYFQSYQFKEYLGLVWPVFSFLTVGFLFLYPISLLINLLLLGLIFIKKDFKPWGALVIVSLIYHFIFCIFMGTRSWYTTGIGANLMVVSLPVVLWVACTQRDGFVRFGKLAKKRWTLSFCFLAMVILSLALLTPAIANDFRFTRILFVASDVKKDKMARLEKAVNAFDLGPKLSSDGINNSFLIAQIYRYLRDERGMDNHDLDVKGKINFYLKQALEVQPQNPDLLFVIANEYFNTKDFRNAELFYQKLLEIDPNFEYAMFIHLRLALLFHMKSQWSSAYEHQKMADLGYIAQYIDFTKTLSEVRDPRIAYIQDTSSKMFFHENKTGVVSFYENLGTFPIVKTRFSRNAMIETDYIKFKDNHPSQMFVGTFFNVKKGKVHLQVVDRSDSTALEVVRTPYSLGSGLIVATLPMKSGKYKLILKGEEGSEMILRGFVIMPNWVGQANFHGVY